MSDENIRRLPAALDAPLARLADSREEIAKAWLMRVLERASLEEIEQMQTERIARELPELIADVVGAMGEGVDWTSLEPGDERLERVKRLIAFRSEEHT